MSADSRAPTARASTPASPAAPTSSEAPALGDDLLALQAVMEGTARTTGEEFFQSLVRHLAQAIDVNHAFVTEFTDARTRVRTLGAWDIDHISPNFEFDLPGTPCYDVIAGNLCHCPTGLPQRYPQDRGMIDMGIDSYLGVPMHDAQGEVIGHLAVFDERPMPPEPRRLFIFRLFAARAAAEAERVRAEKRVADSERRYRSLYEDAPTAYVEIGNDGRLLRANRRVAELLGRAIEELVGTRFIEHLPPEAAARLKAEQALQRALSGQEVAGVELELRRRDSRPAFVSLWATPLHDTGRRVSAVRSVWVDVTDRVLAEREQARLQQQNQYLQEEIRAQHNFDEIVGQSPVLQKMLDGVRQVGPTDATVLISGETGTGKELAARAVHALSRRSDKPLIKVNCAALPSGLVESELFGHEKGAFTGAIARRIGRFELAEGGTLFLDEVGELPPDTQAKLLRVLQEREFERVGGTQSLQVNVRVIAATNRNLQQAVLEKTFREDLFYRLNVFPLRLPPLRERRADIPLLAQYFLQRCALQLGKRFDRIEPDTLERLNDYHWPGNIRELENVIERAVILCEGTELAIPADVLVVPPGDAADHVPAPADATDLESVERRHIWAALDQTGGIIDGPRGAARILGLHPNTLRSRMKRLGIARVAGREG